MITFIISSFQDNPICTNSLLEQKDPNWRAIVVHDGPALPDQLRCKDDPRIKYYQTVARQNDTGDSTKAFGLTQLTDQDELVCYTNMDNYYTPEFVRQMNATLQNPNLDGAYCNCLHNYFLWNVLDCSLGCGGIDCGCFVMRASIAKIIGWKGRGPFSDWHMIHSMLSEGFKNIEKVNRILFVHN